MVDQQVTTPNQLDIQKAQYAAIIKNLNRALRADFSDDSNAEIFAGLRYLENFFRYYDIAVEDERIAANYLMLQNPHIAPQEARVVEDFLDSWDEKYKNVTRQMPVPVSAGFDKPLVVYVTPDSTKVQVTPGSGAGWQNHPVVDKRTPLCAALRASGFEIDIHDGAPPPAGSISTAPYDIIEVTKDGVKIAQIAVCRKIGQSTFVKKQPCLAPEQWPLMKDQLRALGAQPFNYDKQGHWLKRLCDYITTDQQTPPIEENAPPPAPKALKKRDSTPMTLELITEWLWLSIEHDIADGGLGDAASSQSGDIWIKNDQGEWVTEGREWSAVQTYSKRRRLPSLATLKQTLGIDNTMSLAEVQRRFLLAVQHSTNNTAPNQRSGPVMHLDKQGNWVPPKETKQNWNNVNLWLRINKNSSLKALKEGLVDAGLLLEIGQQKGRVKNYQVSDLGEEYLAIQNRRGELTVELFLAKRARNEPMTVEGNTAAVELLTDLRELQTTR